jgi:hypothetical protein
MLMLMMMLAVLSIRMWVHHLRTNICDRKPYTGPPPVIPRVAPVPAHRAANIEDKKERLMKKPKRPSKYS